MILEIGEGFLALNTAKDIWLTIYEIYSRRAQVYDLQRSIDRLDHAELTSLQYYFTLTTLWQRLDHLTDYILIVLLILLYSKKFIDRQQVFKFLAVLRDEYDQVWYRILNIDPVPSLREVFVIIQNEESFQGVMLPPIPFERSSLVSVAQFERRTLPTHRDSGSSVEDEVVVVAILVLIISTVVEPPPSGFKFRALSTSKIELIRNMMSRLDMFSGASSSFAYSGASDHMTGQSNLFSSYIPYTGLTKLK
ncbi:hypothetical protein Acr_07g0013030 [Actinidia rufa]|uniref:Uncharacterized protein n=1 Tax=Actinidia rufa TaxID=165716 RepID=A0A7J0EZQ1_9ERIC|nr:hypothetical protein Acr_07g0013030 [Actinidia rufa]